MHALGSADKKDGITGVTKCISGVGLKLLKLNMTAA